MKELAFLIVGFGLGIYCAKTKGAADRAKLESELTTARAALEASRQQK